MKKIIITLSLILSLSAVFAPGIIVFAEEQNRTDIISYGTIIEENTINTNSSSSEYTIEEIPLEISTYDAGNNDQVTSNYTNPVKLEENAGTHVINYNDETVFVEYDAETKNLVNKTALSDAPGINTLGTTNEYFTVENGIITSASEANIITLGGAEKINYMYPTVEDAYNKTNGITISGGAEYGSYSETVTYEGVDFVHVTISGYEGYMYLNNVQIIPSYIEMNTSYYFAQEGIWYFASATDPLVSNEYMIMPISDAPTWAKEGVRYYSNDTETFTTDEYMTPTTYVDYQNQAYFQNLSLRSTTYYSGSQLKSFLTYKGKSASQYYNSTQAFIDAQNEFGINGLLLFSMANLEGAYGTSHYSNLCNNFFGRGAYDSDPDQACEGRNFPQPEDGIMAQAIFLSINFLDQADWRYEGSYVGSKSGGINVHYASDPNWGQSIGSLAYECDKYLGSKDNNYFKIVQINGDVPVYTTSSMTTQVRAQGAFMCNADKSECIDPDNPNSYVEYYIGKQSDLPVRVVVTDETANAYEIQVETPKNQGSSRFVTWTYAETGDYPNYEGHNHGAEGQSDENYVSSGYINFANDYGNMSANQFWIPKTYNGSTTTTTVANNPIKDTQRYLVYEDCTIQTSSSTNLNGDKVIVKKASDGSQICTTTYYGNTNTPKLYVEDKYYQGIKREQTKLHYDVNGKKYARENWKFDSMGRTDYYVKNDYSVTTGKQTHYKDFYQNDSAQTYLTNEKWFNESTGTQLKLEIKKFENNHCYNRQYYKYDTQGRTDYYVTNDFHKTSGIQTHYRETYYYDSGDIFETTEKWFNASTGKIEKEEHEDYSSNKVYARRYWTYDINGKVNYHVLNNFNSSGKQTSYSEYLYNSKGYITQNNQVWFDSNGNKDYGWNNYYNSVGQFMYKTKVYY